MRNSIQQIFLAGVESVLPDQLIRSQVKLKDGILSVAEASYTLASFKHIYVVGAGKASALMAKEMEQLLGKSITAGRVVVKYGHVCALNHLKITEAGHPLPDKNGVIASQSILKIASQADEHDLVFCLLSGGASALLADFPAGATLEELILTNDLLVKCGANIKEINTVRKHLSNIKGGQLAKAIYPATTISLILSDVIGDPIDVIASGPTSDDKSTFKEALAIIAQYNLEAQLPSTMMRHLQNGNKGLIAETPKQGDVVFSKMKNYLIGSNSIALAAAAHTAEALGFTPHIITAELSEDYTKVGDFILKSIEKYQEQRTDQPLCLLFGGEPTVKVTGDGLGGRNQHLALYCAIKLEGKQGITLLCAGTDGTDGPTDAAGAIIDGQTATKAKADNIDPIKYLHNADSYHFFKQVGGQLITGSTNTNVMDIMVAIIK